MPDDLSELEGDLAKLGKRLRQGWAKVHPVSDREKAAVTQVVREEWEKEQQVAQSQPPTKEQSSQQTKQLGDDARRRSPQRSPNGLSREPPEQDRSL